MLMPTAFTAKGRRFTTLPPRRSFVAPTGEIVRPLEDTAIKRSDRIDRGPSLNAFGDGLLRTVFEALANGDLPSHEVTRLLSTQLAAARASPIETREMALEGQVKPLFQLCDMLLAKVLVTPHQRPCAAAIALQEFAFMMCRAEPSWSGEFALRCILDAQGGVGRSAKDTGHRWRSCALLVGFVKGILKSRSVAAPSVQLLEDVGAALIEAAQDRSSDVRLLGVEGLHWLSLSTHDAQETVTRRALQDCDPAVRAFSVRALVAHTEIVPATIVERARLDCAPRVRRILLEELERKLRKGSLGLVLPWREAVMRGFADRSPSVRAAAVRCLSALIDSNPRTWMNEVVADLQLVESVAGDLAYALHRIMCWRASTPQPTLLEQQLDVRRAFEAIDPFEAAPGATVFVRVSVSTARASKISVDARLPELLIMAALDRGEIFGLRQALIVALVGDLPVSSEARVGLVRAAAAVLLKAPVYEATDNMLSHGIFPRVRLGAISDSPRPATELAMLLLRRLVCGDKTGVRTGSLCELWFSKTIGSILVRLQTAVQQVKREQGALENELDVARVDADELEWDQRASAERRRIARDALQGAEGKASAAKKRCEELNSRSVVCVMYFLELTRSQLGASSGDQVSQAELLERVLRPAVRESSAEELCARQLAAVRGIAIYASKTAEQAMAHWEFFSALIESNCARLQEAIHLPGREMILIVGDLRLLEIAVLFIVDTLLLHGLALGRSRVSSGFASLARLLWSLDWSFAAARGGKTLYDLAYLRAVTCDRVCCLIVMGDAGLGGSAAKWILGRLLAFVCGIGLPSAKGPCEGADAAGHSVSCPDARGQLSLMNVIVQDNKFVRGLAPSYGAARVESSVMCGRLLRFLASLPLLSLAHGELLASAAEAFFAARQWVVLSDSDCAGGGGRVTPAVRAARLVCTRLLLLGGTVARGLQLRVLRALVEARLLMAAEHAGSLCDALVAGVLASTRGGTVANWLGVVDAQPLLQTLSVLLDGWRPGTAAKSVEGLLLELPGKVHSTSVAWAFARGSLDDAADFRRDAAELGLANPLFCAAQRFRECAAREASARGPQPVCRDRSRSPARSPQPPRAASTLHNDLRGAPLMQEHSLTAWRLVDRFSGIAWHLPEGGSLTLGRRTESDIVVGMAVVSGKHCTVAMHAAAGGRWVVEVLDHGGTNGTFVNEARLERNARRSLRVGDVLTLAHAKNGPQFVLFADVLAEAPQSGPGLIPPCIGARKAGADTGENSQTPRKHCVLDFEECNQGCEHEAKEKEEKERTNVKAERPFGSVDAVDDSRITEKVELGLSTPQRRSAGAFGAPTLHTCTSERITKRRRLSTKTADDGMWAGRLLGHEPLAQLPPQLRLVRSSPEKRSQPRQSPPHSVKSKTRKQWRKAKRVAQLPQPVLKLQHATLGNHDTVTPSQASVAVKIAAAVADTDCKMSRLIDLQSGTILHLPLSGILSAGRRQDCELVVTSPLVSSRHCVFLCGSSGIVEVEDTSANGTLVNDVRVPRSQHLPQRVPLRHGDRLTLAKGGPSFLFIAKAT